MELEGKGVKYILLDTSVLVNCTLVNAADADPCNGRGYLDTDLPYAATSVPC